MTTIKIRGGTAAQWASANPVLAAREPGVETDTGVYKVGDGSTAWASLNPVLNSTYARRGLPSYAPASTALNLYDATRNAYNWKASNTRRLRAALGKAVAGTANAHLWFIGDSETENYVGTGYDQLNMWPVVVRRTLASLGVPTSGDGFVKIYTPSGSAHLDPRWTLSGTWTVASNYVSSSTNGDTATFVSNLNCTNIDAFFSDASATSGWDFAVDGGAATHATITASATVKKVSFTGLSGSATHTLVATNTATTAQTSYLIGACAYTSSGVLVHNSGVNGGTAQGWTGAFGTFGYGWAAKQVAAFYNSGVIDCLFISLGVNDIASRTAAQITADLTTIAGQFPSTDIVLIGQYQKSAVSLATWQGYISALYTLADTLDFPLVDLLDRSGGYTTANANGLMGDTVHPTSAGQRDWGRVVGLLAGS